MGKLDGKVAVITGGASGIGAAAVRLFVEEGCRVVIADVQDSSFVNGHALIVDGGLIGGRMWSVVQEQRQQLRAALGIGA